MMDYLRELTRNLVLILVLAAFLEMLLPGKKFKPYLRLVVGLFVLLTIVQPILEFVDQDLQFHFTMPEASIGQRDTILADGYELQKHHGEEAAKTIQNNLEKQVEAMIYLIPQVEKVETSLSLGVDGDNLFIEKVSVNVQLDSQQQGLVEMVEPVQISPENRSNAQTGERLARDSIPGKQTIAKTKRKIQNSVGAFLALEPDLIQVVMVGDHE